MGNVSAGDSRSDAPASDRASGQKCVTTRISSSVIYYYSPPSEAEPDAPRSPRSLSPSRPAASSSPPPSASGSRPLLVFFSWFGAKPGPVAKYRDVYLDRGLDVLWVQSGVLHFLWPRWGRDYGLKVLDVLEEPRFSSRPVVVHASSIGGYTFTHILHHVAHGEKRHQGLARRVVGHVYDSLVVGDLEYMARGLGKTLLPRFHALIKHLAMFYFWLLESQTAVFYQRLVQVFRHSPVASPALFFYSQDDALCHTAAIEGVIDLWRRRGVAVHSRKWERSTHAAHMRRHPEDYLAALQHFLSSLPLSPPESQM